MDLTIPHQVVLDLQRLAGEAEPVVLCFEGPPPSASWCHRALVSAWLLYTNGLGYRILEFESRCAVIRTVGSNPTLSAKKWQKLRGCRWKSRFYRLFYRQRDRSCWAGPGVAHATPLAC